MKYFKEFIAVSLLAFLFVIGSFVFGLILAMMIYQ